MILILGRVIPFHTTSFSKIHKDVLEIDIETAWHEMGLVSAWNNEVAVEIFMSQHCQ
jgi:hypothetical protein